MRGDSKGRYGLMGSGFVVYREERSRDFIFRGWEVSRGFLSRGAYFVLIFVLESFFWLLCGGRTDSGGEAGVGITYR